MLVCVFRIDGPEVSTCRARSLVGLPASSPPSTLPSPISCPPHFLYQHTYRTCNKFIDRFVCYFLYFDVGAVRCSLCVGIVVRVNIAVIYDDYFHRPIKIGRVTQSAFRLFVFFSPPFSYIFFFSLLPCFAFFDDCRCCCCCCCCIQIKVKGELCSV